MARGRKGGAVQSKIQMLLYGAQGCGKSTQALQLMYLKTHEGRPFRVLYLDGEAGSIDDMLPQLEADGINLDNLYIIYTQSLKEVNEFIKRATNKEPFYEFNENGDEDFDSMILDSDGNQFIPDAIVVDGTTVLNLSVKQGLIEFSKKRAIVKAERDKLLGDEKFVKVEGAGLELKDYNSINFKGQDLVLTLTASGLHYIITARETDEKIQIKDSDGKITSISTGKKIAEGFKEMGYNVKTEIRLYRDDDEPEIVKAYVVKDRTKTYNAGNIIEDPSLLSFQAVIDSTKNFKENVVQNGLHEAVKKEMKEVEKEVLNVTEDDNNDVPWGNDSDSTKENIDDLKKELKGKMSALSVKMKEEMKQKLVDNDLPLAFKNVTDIEVIKKALSLFN